MFVADYYAYIKYESQGALRLNKHARGILYSFCPFSKNVVSAFGDNPQFAPLISKREAELKQREKQLTNLVSKIEKSGHAVPDKIRVQIHQLQLG